MRVHMVPRHGSRPKVQAMESALLRSCPFPISVVDRPVNAPDVLLLMYGAGSSERTALLQEHVAAGGKAICFDRGYFGRSEKIDEEHYRFAIDELHVNPKHLESTPEDASRAESFGLSLREDAMPNGHVVVVGLGQKSRTGLALHDWERKTLAATQRRFPSRRVVYRPKTRGGRTDGIRWRWIDGKRPIELVLRGASLVVTRHSNVAVDACVAGVPVECEDGAARWLYAASPYQAPDRRKSFLCRLAWWNWKSGEAKQAWEFLLPRLQ